MFTRLVKLYFSGSAWLGGCLLHDHNTSMSRANSFPWLLLSFSELSAQSHSCLLVAAAHAAYIV